MALKEIELDIYRGNVSTNLFETIRNSWFTKKYSIKKRHVEENAQNQSDLEFVLFETSEMIQIDENSNIIDL